MSAHQCPRCPLLFSFRTEVEWHLANDHRVADDAKPDVADTTRDTDGEGTARAPAVAASGQTT